MLIKRNILLFFRDKANVFFSLLAVFIIIGLHVLFLGNMLEQVLQAELGFQSDKAGIVMTSITLAGMVAVTSVTSCMGALGISVADKKDAVKDFLTSPVSRGKITISYILGSAAVGLIMTVTALILCIIYITANGGSVPGFTDTARLLLTAVLSVLCGNSMVYFVTTLVKSQNAFSAVSTVIGTLIGFLMGIYIPVGTMPNAVQWVIKCFPMSHAAGMFKQVIADGELSELFAAAPPEALEGFREVFGVVFTYGDFTSGFWFSASILAATTAVIYVLSSAVMKARKSNFMH
ncbi:MAG: ABC transporter permease [Defluviitaleaceae bacterium]|nr:ABC transporter permease [Defluviitaleaceae bacterium]